MSKSKTDQKLVARRYAALVKGYWDRGRDYEWFASARAKLEDEHSAVAVFEAGEAYEEGRIAACESEEERRWAR